MYLASHVTTRRGGKENANHTVGGKASGMGLAGMSVLWGEQMSNYVIASHS